MKEIKRAINENGIKNNLFLKPMERKRKQNKTKYISSFLSEKLIPVNLAEVLLAFRAKMIRNLANATHERQKAKTNFF